MAPKNPPEVAANDMDVLTAELLALKQQVQVLANNNQPVTYNYDQPVTYADRSHASVIVASPGLAGKRC